MSNYKTYYDTDDYHQYLTVLIIGSSIIREENPEIDFLMMCYPVQITFLSANNVKNSYRERR